MNPSGPEAKGYRAALIGDIVGSRTAADRRALHQTLVAALASADAEVPGLDPLTISNGDEFQCGYRRVGDALHAALLISLRLAPEVDARFGVGWGPVEVFDHDHDSDADAEARPSSGDLTRRVQDGPAWWQARAAIETVKERAQHAGTRHARFCYRAGPDGEGPDEIAVDAALLCRDQLMGSLAARSMRILGGLMAGRSKTEIGRAEEISTSAVSQRSQRDGLDVIVAASAMLRELA